MGLPSLKRTKMNGIQKDFPKYIKIVLIYERDTSLASWSLRQPKSVLAVLLTCFHHLVCEGAIKIGDILLCSSCLMDGGLQWKSSRTVNQPLEWKSSSLFLLRIILLDGTAMLSRKKKRKQVQLCLGMLLHQHLGWNCGPCVCRIYLISSF